MCVCVCVCVCVLLAVTSPSVPCRFLTANGNNPTQARAEIERYVAGLVKEANERFANLDTGGFSVRVSLGSIVTFTVMSVCLSVCLSVRAALTASLPSR